MLTTVLRHLLPGICLLCDVPLPPGADPDLCPCCLDSLPWNRAACPRCAEPLPNPAAATGRDCGACRRSPPPFSRTLAPLLYDGAPKDWIGQLKDRLGMVQGRILATILAEAAERLYHHYPPAPDLLVPVPLTRGRLARRGHNQALTLARPVAARLGVPLARQGARRVRGGPSQRGASRRRRLGNLTGAFASRSRHDGEPVIAIVDDVMTTGATAAALARVLLAAGASDVHVLCACRTAPSGARHRDQ